MKKARMGRPPMRAADRRTERVVLRLTLAQYRRLAAEAKEAGLPLAVHVHKRLCKRED